MTALECKQYRSSEQGEILDCWFIVKSSGDIWLKGADIAKFLHYTKPDQAVRNNVPSKWIQNFESFGAVSPISTMRNGTAFITELGAYTLLSRRIREPGVLNFVEWIHAEIYKLKTQHLTVEQPSTMPHRQHHNMPEFNEQALMARIELARRDADNARFDAEIARLDTLALSHRFITTLQNIFAINSNTAIEEEGAVPQNYMDTNGTTRDIIPTPLPMNIIASTAEQKHHYDTMIDSVAHNGPTGELGLNSDFAQRSADNHEWANETLKRLYEQDPTSLSVVKKQKTVTHQRS